MKFILKLVLLGGPLLAVPSQAFAWGSCGSPGCSSCGWHLCGLNPFNIHGCLAGPWYSYWPYEAHFTAAVPVACAYPFWPGGAGGALPYPGAMSAFPSPAGPMGDFGHAGGGMSNFGSYAGGMGYPGGAGYSYSQPPYMPTAGAYGNSYPVTGTPMQGGPNYFGQ